jgi:cell division protein FtsW (lipid II flippase)
MDGEDKDVAERTTRVVTALLILSPFLCVFCYVLALAQGDSGQASAVIGLAGFAMCLGAASLKWLRGAKATRDLWWIVLILNLFGR